MWPSLISAGASLVGGLINRRSNESAGNKNQDLSRDFAQHGISWKVADAKRAGIHPLYAMGANTSSPGAAYVGDSSLGQSVSNMGQDISRAVQAGQSATARAATEIQKAQLEQLNLQNEGIRLDNQRKTGQLGPPLPFEKKPAEITMSNPDIPHLTAGPSSPGGTLFNMGMLGDNWDLPSGQLNQALEDMGLAKYAYVFANNQEKIARAIADYMEPVFNPIYRSQREIEDAAAAVSSWANNQRNTYYKKRAFAERRARPQKYWGREVR